ncbi:MAG: Fic/DOC family N-terminal domain-containing protein, partial [Sphingomonadaceae bacterium]
MNTKLLDVSKTLACDHQSQLFRTNDHQIGRRIPLPVNYHQGQFPPAELDLATLFPLVGPANAAIARYEGVLAGIPNRNILLSPLTNREAVLSSKIEGTQVTLGEVLEFEAQGNLFDEST